MGRKQRFTQLDVQTDRKINRYVSIWLPKQFYLINVESKNIESKNVGVQIISKTKTLLYLPLHSFRHVWGHFYTSILIHFIQVDNCKVRWIVTRLFNETFRQRQVDRQIKFIAELSSSRRFSNNCKTTRAIKRSEFSSLSTIDKIFSCFFFTSHVTSFDDDCYSICIKSGFPLLIQWFERFHKP